MPRFYSETFRPPHHPLEAGALTLGRRDGAPFFHCHALWREADGKRSGGHILPDEAVLAETAEVEAFGIDGAIFEANPDPETNFKLFGPVAVPARGGMAETRAFALRLRPNQCFHAALEQFVAQTGWAGARIRGGVGSLIGSAFADGTVTEPFATEVYITRAPCSARRMAAFRPPSKRAGGLYRRHGDRPARARREPGPDDI